MCEFKVLTEGGDQVLAEDIIRTFYEGNVLKLTGIMGNVVQVRDAIVSEVNVGKEELRVMRHPIIGAMLKFLEEFLKCQREATYNPLVEKYWSEVKSLGDHMIEKLKASRD